MNMDQAQQMFVDEARDLLLAMEESLLQIEASGDYTSGEFINAIFRAAHTIKGSAGLFSLDVIVGFAHVVEDVLMRVRADTITITPALITLLLQCRDYLGNMIDDLEAGRLDTPAEEQLDARKRLLSELESMLKPCSNGVSETSGTLFSEADNSADVVGNDQATKEEQSEHLHDASAENASAGSASVSSEYWHISLRFSPDILRSGMDPMSFIRYLGSLGTVRFIHTLFDALPPADEMDPESCYLGFEIALESGASKAMIEGVFDLIHDDCTLRILPPHAKIADILGLIKELSEDSKMLGEILIRTNALTSAELDMALEIQRVEDERAESGIDAPSRRPIGKILVDENIVPRQIVSAALDKQKSSEEKRTSEQRFIKVEAGKLDYLINLVGELVIAGASANLLASQAQAVRLVEATSVINDLVERIRDGALDLRMVQIGETFNRFQRVVRDVSKELGKQIELRISGAETELDKAMVEKLGDPLLHIVRNAMDHGIEGAEERVLAEKPATGTLRLNAYHQSGSIVIEVSDNGRGINRAKVRAKAIERGLIDVNDTLSDQETLMLIFEAGFSTAEQVTNLSGRGVGMDVVKRAIESLRGEIEIDSVEGVGTTLKIRLPLTLAIIDGFQVAIDASTFVLPLDAIVECIDLPATEAHSQSHYINLRGEVLPFLRLRDLFDIRGPRPLRESIVVVQHGDSRVGMVVDRLVGEFQTVIKPLGELFRHVRGLAGSTILGSGEVALILDIAMLVEAARHAERQTFNNHSHRNVKEMDSTEAP